MSDTANAVGGVSKAVLVQSSAATGAIAVSGIPLSGHACIARNVVVTAYDDCLAASNVETDYRGTVSFSSSDARATLPARYTFTASDNGTHLFSAGVTLRSPGVSSVSAVETVAAGLTSTQSGISVPLVRRRPCR